jgi:nucleotide-binding universal stress UspA family protein
MKQRILVVDDRIRSMIEHDTDEKFLKKSAQFSYKYAIALTLALVVAWPLPLYFSGYVFSLSMYHAWVGIAFVWAVCAAAAVILLPLVEAKRGIVEVLRRIYMVFTASGIESERRRPDAMEEIDRSRIRGEYEARRILVAIDGSKESLQALTYASYLFDESTPTRIFLLNVIEWTDENDGSLDERLSAEMEEEGRRMLRSVVIPKRLKRYERIVKLGDPGTKIAETADRLNVDMIVMGRKGLGSSQSEMGHVSAKVLKLSAKPVVFL